MTLGSLLRQKRTLNKMTRHQLAEKMNISDVTLYRLENDSNVRVTQEMVEQLKKLLDLAEIRDLPEKTEWEKQMKGLLLGEETRLPAYFGFERRNDISAPFLQRIEAQLTSLGYQCSIDEGAHFACCAVNESTGKKWGILLRASDSRLSFNSLNMDIGFAVCHSDSLQKVSIAFLGECPRSVLDFVSKYKNGLANCPFDFSLLSIDLDTKRISREEEIVLKRDGSGFFPFDTDENAALVEYGRWKMSLL